MNDEILGRKPFNVKHVPSFTANIMIPYGEDREQFVKKCYETGTVMVQGDDGLIAMDATIDVNCLKIIQFPPIPGITGTSVQCLWDVMKGIVRVVGVYMDSNSIAELSEENQYRITRGGENGDYVDLDLKGEDGQINIIAKTTKTKKKSSIKILSKSKDAELEVVVQGTTRLINDGVVEVKTKKGLDIEVFDTDDKSSVKTKIKYTPKEGLVYEDEFGNILKTNKEGFEVKDSNGEVFKMTKKGFSIYNNQINLKEQLNNLLDALTQVIVQTPSGPGSFDANTIQSISKVKTGINKLFE